MFHVFTIIISQNIWTIKFSYLTLLLFYFLELKLLGLRKSKWLQKWLYSNSHETGMMSMINKMQILVLTVMRLEWCHIDWFQYQPVMLYRSTTVHPNLGFFFFCSVQTSDQYRVLICQLMFGNKQMTSNINEMPQMTSNTYQGLTLDGSQLIPWNHVILVHEFVTHSTETLSHQPKSRRA